MPDISACILSYNRADYISSAIESVIQQTLAPAEILIFDNGSDSSVYDRVRPYLNQGVTWIGSEITRSAAWNFRRAVSTAKSEYIFVLHDDDRLCTSFIELQLSCLKQYPDVCAVTCNGYLIDEQGKRKGRLLTPTDVDREIEFYRTPAAVAIRYASDSCLPFSPVVYRADFVRAMHLRDDLGKVFDAVFFCELARVGTIAYQIQPLYECRVHQAQDSSHLPIEELELLTKYFENDATGSEIERKRLRHLLVRQHTSRQLIRIYNSALLIQSVPKLISEIKGLAHQRFSIIAATSICVTAIIKRVKGGRLKHDENINGTI